MTCNQELQQEELEVLRSIYDGDEHFKELSPTAFQYKIGMDSDPKSILLEMSWGENYPEELPCFNLDTFYNKHLAPTFKSYLAALLTEQAEPMKGMAMTYSLFEYVKENIDEIFAHQSATETSTAPVCATREEQDESRSTESGSVSGAKKDKEKKEQLTKAQKRKIINRQDVNGEMPRGWNWVDVVKHLCQTGKGSEGSIVGTPLSHSTT
jgi:3'-phosphoadenosine 5'-phosphosulfate sulfotransferase (PAPS reductase)/FAD synthetase